MIAVPNDLVNPTAVYCLCLRIIFQKDQGRDNFFLELADSTSVAIIAACETFSAQERAAHLSKFIPHMRQFSSASCEPI
jgi:hypothetical protein